MSFIPKRTFDGLRYTVEFSYKNIGSAPLRSPRIHLQLQEGAQVLGSPWISKLKKAFDFEFNNTEEWYESIPVSIRPKKEQPFYHVFAENDQVFYQAYVSQQNLLVDDSNIPVEHPDVPLFFGVFEGDTYKILENTKN